MSGTVEHYEYGYRLDEQFTERAGKYGLEMWSYEHGNDGTWIGGHFPLGISHVDIREGTDTEGIVADIQKALSDAGVRGVILRAKVTTITHDAEIIA